MVDAPTTSLAPRGGASRLRRVLGRLWRFSLGRWIRRVDFLILRRNLDQPTVALPQGRRSPIKEGESFFVEHGTQRHVDMMVGTFPPKKIAHFRRCVDDPGIDMPVRIREDGMPWCYMMHACATMRDPIYGFRLPLAPGRDILQFDGWVNPEYRGLMIGILGTNSSYDCREAEGFERVYDVIRKIDKRSARLHQRMGFTQVGSIRHLRIGPLRFNRMQWDPGEHPLHDGRGEGGQARFRDWPDEPGNVAPNRTFAHNRGSVDAHNRDSADARPGQGASGTA